MANVQSLETFVVDDEDGECLILRAYLADGSVRSAWWHLDDFLLHCKEVQPPKHAPERAVLQ